MSERNYYKDVQDEFRLKREMAEARRERVLSEIHKSVPKVAEIDALLAKTALRILTIMQGEGTSLEKEEGVAKIKAENDALRKQRGEILMAAGFAPDCTDVKYECEACSDSGFVGLDMCICMKSAIAEARLRDSELGRLAGVQSFENFDFSYYKEGPERENIRRNYNRLRSFAESFNSESEQSFILLGDTGLGKTHLSTSTGIAVIRRGYSVVYKTVQSVMDDYQQVQFRGGDSAGIDKYYNCDLLIVDDLGAEMSTQFTVSCIYNLINTRINKRKPTIFSTNLTQQELRERYSDRITSRLFGEFAPLVFKGCDVRRQKLSRK